jgi:hypothetical protein
MSDGLWCVVSDALGPTGRLQGWSAGTESIFHWYLEQKKKNDEVAV